MGDVHRDAAKPDGQTRRCLDTIKTTQALGWTAQVGFEEGLKQIIAWFATNRDETREVTYG